MAEDAEERRRSEAGRASQLALKAASKIADWCEVRKEVALRDAALQMRTVWILLAGGVILLLLLPRLVALIDYTAATLPPDAVQEADAALALMETNKTEMNEELNQAQKDLNLRETQQTIANNNLEEAVKNFRTPFEHQLSVWKRATPNDLSIQTRTIYQRDKGPIIVAGSEGTESNSNILFLVSSEGKEWMAVRAKDGGETINGRIYAISSLPDGDFIAAGHEIIGDVRMPIFLRSKEGTEWTIQRPAESGSRISGSIFAISRSNSLGFFAAGYEQVGEKRNILFFRLLDGNEWVPLRPDRSGTRIEGTVRSILPAPDGGIMAVGYSGDRENPKTLILSSVDAIEWLTVRLDEPGGYIRGRLFTLALDPQGGFIAAGLRQVGSVSTISTAFNLNPFPSSTEVLILRSQDGKSWQALRPEEMGGRQGGLLFHLLNVPDVGVLAAGSADTARGEQPLILRSSTGEAWVPILFSSITETRVPKNFWRLLSTADGTLLAGGDGTSIMRLTPDLREEVQEAILTGEIEEDFTVPDRSIETSEVVRQRNSDLKFAIELVEQQQTIVDQAQESYTRQTDAVEQITKANINLENALRRTEPVRQASWIATRLGVIALIIFLVQISVNRYRYLQRLADFYDGRAQAFRMLANSGPTAAGAILHEVSLNDLMAGLSPSSIGFGRAPEPPTQQLMSVLQAAVKK